jgi:hypothetical protein
MRLGIEFLLEVRVFRTAGAGTMRAAGLRHEALNDAMKHDTVIKAFADELLDVFDVFRREVGTHFDDDRAFGRLERQRVSGFGHEYVNSRRSLR